MHSRPGKHRIEFDFKYDGLGAGTLAKLTIKVERPQLSPADMKQLEPTGRNNRMSE